MKRRYILMILSLLTTVLLMSACSQPITGPTTGTGSSLTPLQVLQNSANAMQQLKSAHVEIQSTNSVQPNDTAGTATTGTPTSTSTPTSSTPTPTTFSLALKASGDEALPDQEQLNLKIGRAHV